MTTSAKVSATLAAVQAAASESVPPVPDSRPVIIDRAPGVTYTTNLERLDLESMLRTGDDATRKVFQAALARYNECVALVDRARDIRYSADSLAKLKAHGIAIDEKLESAAYFRLTPDAAGHFVLQSPDGLGEAERELGRQIRAALDAAVEPAIKRLASALLADLESELAKIDAFEGPLMARWAQSAAPQTHLRAQLTHAIATLRHDLARPFDSSWHPDPRIHLSAYLAGEPL